jgi:LysM domain
MHRTRVRWKRVGLLLASGAISVVLASGAAHAGGAGEHPPAVRSTTTRVYVVHQGDTIWSIATGVVGRGADPRPLVDAIAERNHVTGAIVPGQRLVVPTS